MWDLDSLQYELGEEPCLHAIHTEPVTVMDDLRNQQRWPRYVPRALENGLAAQMGLRLFADGETFGGLNLYSTDPRGIDAVVEQSAELFADHAALALSRARREDDLNSALINRTTIGQAVGIVMERHHMDEDRAFQHLLRVSQHSNTKLREVAQEVVARENDRSHRDDAHQNPMLPGGCPHVRPRRAGQPVVAPATGGGPWLSEPIVTHIPRCATRRNYGASGRGLTTAVAEHNVCEAPRPRAARAPTRPLSAPGRGYANRRVLAVVSLPGAAFS